jgi:hypothetical protein
VQSLKVDGTEASPSQDTSTRGAGSRRSQKQSLTAHAYESLRILVITVDRTKSPPKASPELHVRMLSCCVFLSVALAAGPCTRVASAPSLHRAATSICQQSSLEPTAHARPDCARCIRGNTKADFLLDSCRASWKLDQHVCPAVRVHNSRSNADSRLPESMPYTCAWILSLQQFAHIEYRQNLTEGL